MVLGLVDHQATPEPGNIHDKNFGEQKQRLEEGKLIAHVFLLCVCFAKDK